MQFNLFAYSLVAICAFAVSTTNAVPCGAMAQAAPAPAAPAAPAPAPPASGTI
jgi:hypothetical protein